MSGPTFAEPGCGNCGTPLPPLTGGPPTHGNHCDNPNCKWTVCEKCKWINADAGSRVWPSGMVPQIGVNGEPRNCGLPKDMEQIQGRVEEKVEDKKGKGRRWRR